MPSRLDPPLTPREQPTWDLVVENLVSDGLAERSSEVMADVLIEGQRTKAAHGALAARLRQEYARRHGPTGRRRR